MSETASLDGANVLGECDARPATVLVHNPVATGAFRNFDLVRDDDRLEADLLFRGRPDAALYSEHHDILAQTIARHVDRVVYLGDLLEPGSSCELLTTNPNQVFTRDSLITIPWVPDAFLCARMRPMQRRREAAAMKIAAERMGLREIVGLPDDVFLEGGDVIPFVHSDKRCLLVGYGPRSTADAIDFLQQSLLPDYADEIIAIQLAPWRMNLDGGFVPVAADVIVSDTRSILAAESIGSGSRTRIDIWEMLCDLKISVIETTPDESVYCQSCNCLCIGHREVICYDLCPRVSALLSQHDIHAHRIPGAELIKGRGGPRCMTRPIYQPRAARSSPQPPR